MDTLPKERMLYMSSPYNWTITAMTYFPQIGILEYIYTQVIDPIESMATTQDENLRHSHAQYHSTGA